MQSKPQLLCMPVVTLQECMQECMQECTNAPNCAAQVTFVPTLVSLPGTTSLTSCRRSRPPVGPSLSGVHVNKAQMPSTRTAGGRPLRLQPSCRQIVTRSQFCTRFEHQTQDRLHGRTLIRTAFTAVLYLPSHTPRRQPQRCDRLTPPWHMKPSGQGMLLPTARGCRVLALSASSDLGRGMRPSVRKPSTPPVLVRLQNLPPGRASPCSRSKSGLR